MRPYTFRLHTLLRMHEATRDQRRTELAEAHRAEEMLRARLEELAGELAALRDDCRRSAQPGTVDVDRLLDAQRFEFLILAQRQSLEQHGETLAAERERRREALVAANREVRILEKLRETQLAQHRQEEQRRENKLLDEMAARLPAGEHA